MTDVHPLTASLTGTTLHVVKYPSSSTLSVHERDRKETWSIESPSCPPWLQVFVARINHIARLGHDWDSYGALPPHKREAERAVAFLLRNGFDGPAPVVSPTSDGGIHLEWGYRPFAVEIEIESGQPIQGFALDGPEVDERDTDAAVAELLPVVTERLKPR